MSPDRWLANLSAIHGERLPGDPHAGVYDSQLQRSKPPSRSRPEHARGEPPAAAGALRSAHKFEVTENVAPDQLVEQRAKRVAIQGDQVTFCLASDMSW